MSATIYHWDNDKPSRVTFNGGCFQLTTDVPDRSIRRFDVTSHGQDFHIKLAPGSVKIDSADGVVAFDRLDTGELVVSMRRSTRAEKASISSALSNLGFSESDLENMGLTDLRGGLFSRDMLNGVLGSPLSYEGTLEQEEMDQIGKDMIDLVARHLTFTRFDGMPS